MPAEGDRRCRCSWSLACRGRLGRREGSSDLRRRHEYRLHKKGGAGQGGRGSSTESTEGTRARRAVPSRATERRAWGGAVGPRGRSVHGRSCSGAFGSDEAPAQRRAFEVDAMGAIDDAVENGVSQGGIANDFMPATDRDLAGDQERPPVVAIVDDLEQIATLLGVERFRPPIVNDQ